MSKKRNNNLAITIKDNNLAITIITGTRNHRKNFTDSTHSMTNKRDALRTISKVRGKMYGVMKNNALKAKGTPLMISTEQKRKVSNNKIIRDVVKQIKINKIIGVKRLTLKIIIQNNNLQRIMNFRRNNTKITRRRIELQVKKNIMTPIVILTNSKNPV